MSNGIVPRFNYQALQFPPTFLISSSYTLQRERREDAVASLRMSPLPLFPSISLLLTILCIRPLRVCCRQNSVTGMHVRTHTQTRLHSHMHASTAAAEFIVTGPVGKGGGGPSYFSLLLSLLNVIRERPTPGERVILSSISD